MTANVPFVANKDCSEKFANTQIKVYDTYLCAGGKNKTDTCHGDSGGPIQAVGTVNYRPKMVLYGVVSGL